MRGLVALGLLASLGVVAGSSCGGRQVANARASCSGGGAGAGPSCGVAGDDDCCASATVQGGLASTTFVGPDYQIGVLEPTVSSFALDRYEVTVGRFRAFVSALGSWAPVAGTGADPRVPGSGWQQGWPLAKDEAALRAALATCPGTWMDTVGAHEKEPITCITWYELFAFCAWDGGRLPTMTEKAYASLGGAENRAFPWSDPPDSGTLGTAYAIYAPEGGTLPTGPAQVGSRSLGAGRWGHLDLAGNASEWSLDGYPPDSYPLPARACVDCAVVALDGGARVHQGGSFLSGPADLRSFGIAGANPLERSASRGGRCARSLPNFQFDGGAVGPLECSPPPSDGGSGCTGCVAGAVSSSAFTCDARMAENTPTLSETLEIGSLAAPEDLNGSGFSLVPAGQGHFTVGSYDAQSLDYSTHLLVQGSAIVGVYTANGADPSANFRLVLSSINRPANGSAPTAHGSLDANLRWSGYAGSDVVLHVRF